MTTDPTDDQIAAVLAKTSDPRALAIAYLRAKTRATEAEKALAARGQMRSRRDTDAFVSELFGLGRGNRR